MAVILSYHTLVQRDSKYIDYKWKSFIVAILIIVIGSSIAASFSMKYLSVSFEELCILRTTDIKVIFYNSTTNGRVETRIDETAVPLANTDTVRIDRADTLWTSVHYCEFAMYGPLVGGLFGVIWTAIFLMCGHGGRDDTVFLSQPWRIVIPAMLYFGIMALFSFIHLMMITEGLDMFCGALKMLEPDNDKKLGCHDLLNKYAIDKYWLNRNTINSSGFNYDMVLVFSQLIFCFWLLAFVIMLLRCIFVIDFQLIRVTITVQSKNQNKNDSETENDSGELLSSLDFTNISLPDTDERSLPVDQSPEQEQTRKSKSPPDQVQSLSENVQPSTDDVKSPHKQVPFPTQNIASTTDYLSENSKSIMDKPFKDVQDSTMTVYSDIPEDKSSSENEDSTAAKETLLKAEKPNHLSPKNDSNKSFGGESEPEEKVSGSADSTMPSTDETPGQAKETAPKDQQPSAQEIPADPASRRSTQKKQASDKKSPSWRDRLLSLSPSRRSTRASKESSENQPESAPKTKSVSQESAVPSSSPPSGSKEIGTPATDSPQTRPSQESNESNDSIKSPLANAKDADEKSVSDETPLIKKSR